MLKDTRGWGFITCKKASKRNRLGESSLAVCEISFSAGLEWVRKRGLGQTAANWLGVTGPHHSYPLYCQPPQNHHHSLMKHHEHVLRWWYPRIAFICMVSRCILLYVTFLLQFRCFFEPTPHEHHTMRVVHFNVIGHISDREGSTGGSLNKHSSWSIGAVGGARF